MAAHKSFGNAIKWSFAGIWGEKALVSLFTVVLAALLGPKDFGLVAIAWVFVNFIQMFLDQGLGAALVQKKDLRQEHLDSVFSMDLVLSLLLVAGTVLLSGWWAAINHAPQVALLISVLSICIPIEALASVQKVVLSKGLDFKSLSIRSTIAALVGGIVGVVMAWAKLGAWSIVGQQITRDLVSLVLLWRLSSWRPKWSFSWPHLRELMSFSLSNFTAQLGVFADTQASSILVGIFLGPVPVGLYRLADRIMNSVVGAGTSSIQAVSLPEFSRLQDKPAELRNSVLTCIRLSSTITLPALAGLAAVSNSLMATVGEKWIPAADILKVLCLVGMVTIFAYFTAPLLQALARPYHLALIEWARTGLGVCFLIVAGILSRHASLNNQMMAIASARLVAAALLMTPIFLYILMRLAKLSIRHVAAAVAPSIASSTAVVAIILLFQFTGIFANSRPMITLVVEMVLAISVGVPVLLMLDPELRRAVQRGLSLSRFTALS